MSAQQPIRWMTLECSSQPRTGRRQLTLDLQPTPAPGGSPDSGPANQPPIASDIQALGDTLRGSADPFRLVSALDGQLVSRESSACRLRRSDLSNSRR